MENCFNIIPYVWLSAQHQLSYPIENMHPLFFDHVAQKSVSAVNVFE